FHVTGVQTCALPIFAAFPTILDARLSRPRFREPSTSDRRPSHEVAGEGSASTRHRRGGRVQTPSRQLRSNRALADLLMDAIVARSEERRVGQAGVGG